MSIPYFKSQEDRQEYLNTFDDYWQNKKTLMNRVKDDLFPGYDWHTLTPHTLEVINDIVTNMEYEVERQFKENRPEYKNEDDDVFIPIIHSRRV